MALATYGYGYLGEFILFFFLNIPAKQNKNTLVFNQINQYPNFSYFSEVFKTILSYFINLFITHFVFLKSD